ncbi:MAG: hypothetical protein J6M05_04490 [Cardiobacteriaceae bacterium]|nr:hypothetical protein [Cardiobacteriaceae bacterium]
MTYRNRQHRLTSAISLALLSCGICITSNAQENSSKQNYQQKSDISFSVIPAYLEAEKKTTTTKSTVKPRLLFVIDNSGSMMFYPTGNGDYHNGGVPDDCMVIGEYIARAGNPSCSPARIGILYSVLNELIGQGSEYENKIKFGYLPIWPQGGGDPFGSTFDNITRKMPMGEFASGSKFMTWFSNLYVGGATPTTAAYVSAADEMYNNIKYACQKNYIVVLSDGETNTDGSSYGQDKSGENTVDQSTWRSWNSPIRQVLGDNWVAPNDGSYHYRWDTTYDPETGKFEMYNGKRYEGTGHGIAYFSRQLFGAGEADLKPDDELDVEGNPFEGKQNIQTYTIGFGGEIQSLVNTQKYLEAASLPGLANNAVQLGIPGYLNAIYKDELKEAFSKIFTAIDEETKVSEIQDLQSTSIAAPANLSTTAEVSKSYFDGELKGVLSVLSVHTGNWASRFNFWTFDSDFEVSASDELNEEQSKVASYPNPYHILVQDKSIANNSTGVKSISAEHAPIFGFTGYETEFQTAYLPWLGRKGGVSADADVEIEKQAAEIPSENRFIPKYRDRLGIVKNSSASSNSVSVGTTNSKERINQFTERMMGDVLDSSSVSIPDVAAINGSANGSTDDPAGYLAVGSNDGMLYIYKRNKKDAPAPYSLAVNYLPADAPVEASKVAKFLPLKNAAANIDGLGQLSNVLPLQADSRYGNDIEHIYGVNGGISYIVTSSTFDRNQQAVLLAGLGQGGMGIFALNIGGFDSSKPNPTAVGLDAVGDSTYQNHETVAKKLERELPLWHANYGDNNNGEFINIGYTVGKPVMGHIAKSWLTTAETANQNNDNPLTTDVDETRNATPNAMDEVSVAAFVSNGYLSNPDKEHGKAPTLYIFDALGIDYGARISTLAGDNFINPPRKINGQAGKLIKAIEVKGNDENRFGLNALAPATAVDTNFDGIVDVVYAGDYSGDLWRFDLRYDVGQWKAHKIYDGSEYRPITTAPAVYRINNEDGLRYVIAFGTGSDVFDHDREDMSRLYAQQAFYGVYDNLADTNPEPITEYELLWRYFDGSSHTYKLETGKTVDIWDSQRNIVEIPECDKPLLPLYKNQVCEEGYFRGWYMELNPLTMDIMDGKFVHWAPEQVVTSPSMLLNTVMFTTRQYLIKQPADDYGVPSISNGEEEVESCALTDTKVEVEKSLGSSWLMGVNILTGGPQDEVTFRCDGDNCDENYIGRQLLSFTVAEEDKAVLEPTYEDRSFFPDQGNSQVTSETTIASQQLVASTIKSTSENVIESTDANGGLGDGILDLNIGFDAQNPSVARIIEREKQNKCLTHDDYAVYVALSTGELDHENLKVKLCRGVFMRTSLREVKIDLLNSR